MNSSASDGLSEPGSGERVVNFTDAVVAIAITLLVLPLLEAVSEARTDHLTTSQWLHEHELQIISFAVSFVVVASLWRVHHRLGQHIKIWTTPLLWLNFGWMFTICFLQVPSAMLYAVDDTDGTVLGLYVLTMAASSLISTVMALFAARHPETTHQDRPFDPGYLAASAAATAVFVLTGIVVLVVPGVSAWTLMLLALVPGATRLARRMRSRRGAA